MLIRNWLNLSDDWCGCRDSGGWDSSFTDEWNGTSVWNISLLINTKFWSAWNLPGNRWENIVPWRWVFKLCHATHSNFWNRNGLSGCKCEFSSCVAKNNFTELSSLSCHYYWCSTIGTIFSWEAFII